MSRFYAPHWYAAIIAAVIILAILLLAIRFRVLFYRASWYPTLWDRIKAWWAGRRDGADEVPPKEYRGKLLDQAAHFIQVVAAIGGERDERIARWGRYERAAIAAHNARQQIEQAQSLIQKQNLEGVHSGKKNAPYWLTMVAVGLGEFVFNAVAFEVLGGTQLDTYLMVLTLAIALPGAAHLLGLCVKQSDQRLKNGMVGVALGLVALICMYSINLVRASSVNTGSGAFIHVSPMTYYSMNLLVFVFAIALSYFHNEQHSLLTALKNWEAVRSKSYERFTGVVNARNGNLAYHKRWMQSIGHRTIDLCRTYERAYLRSYRRAHNAAGLESFVSKSGSAQASLWEQLKATLGRDENRSADNANEAGKSFDDLVEEHTPNWPNHKTHAEAFQTVVQGIKQMSSADEIVHPPLAVAAKR